MASSTAHPPFGGRPYGSSLGKLPDRSGGGGIGAITAVAGGFPSTSTTSREAQQRLERERERAAERERERERLEREGNNQFGELTEEQREEINEAVCSLPASSVFFFSYPSGVDLVPADQLADDETCNVSHKNSLDSSI